MQYFASDKTFLLKRAGQIGLPYHFAVKTAVLKVINNITLTKALVVKNAAFILDKFFAETSVC